MKYFIFTLLAALLIVNVACSQKQTQNESLVKWYSIEEALKLNQENPKKIFIDVYTDWCSWCKVMDSKTFSDPIIADYLNKNFYPVKFNAESTAPITYNGLIYENKNSGRRSPHELAIRLLQGRLAYPSVAYLDEKNELITSIPGYNSPDQIEPILKFYSENHYKTTNLESFRRTFVGKTTKK
jgi:thioredoxin-related protein